MHWAGEARMHEPDTGSQQTMASGRPTAAEVESGNAEEASLRVSLSTPLLQQRDMLEAQEQQVSDNKANQGVGAFPWVSAALAQPKRSIVSSSRSKEGGEDCVQT
eukprot:TRINITY_DN15249_c0_g1_i1.p1 TRINITY_DN15249_c0_g1~~TRINITY_DN15249_c0_g1_i1.p1  ORF type:complete len:105 (-),score=25.34 TRINITY_DN15249_c0_g1_i1:106-420(-)